MAKYNRRVTDIGSRSLINFVYKNIDYETCAVSKELSTNVEKVLFSVVGDTYFAVNHFDHFLTWIFGIFFESLEQVMSKEE